MVFIRKLSWQIRYIGLEITGIFVSQEEYD